VAEATRLLTDATEAFVNRAPVDWAALLSRVGASPQRALFENLRTVAALRDAARSARQAPAVDHRFSLAAWLVVALASLETATIFLLLAIALGTGASIAHRVPQLVLALAFTAASVPLGRATFRDPRSLFLLATFTAAASVFARSAVTGPLVAWPAPIDGLFRGVWIEALIPACVWQFALEFPRVPRFTPFDRYARQAATASWLLGVGLFGINLALREHAGGARPLVYLLRDHPSHLFWHLLSLAVAPALVGILVRSRRAPPSERRKVARLAIALAGGTAPFLLLSGVRMALPAVDEWFTGASSAGHTWLYGAIVASLAATPVLSTAAVLADRPFALQRRRRRTSRHTAGWCTVRRAVDSQEQLAAALGRISTARGARETLDVLARELRDGVRAASVRVLIPRGDGAFADWTRDAMVLRPDGGLVTLLRETTRPLDLSCDGPLHALIPPRDRDWAAEHAVHLAAPLRGRDGVVRALVAFGPKIDGAPFDRQDRWWISTLTATGAAWDFDPYPSRPSGSGGPASTGLGEAAFECPVCGVVAEWLPLSCGCGADVTLAALPRCLDGKFLVQRRIGAGGMGIVYLARDTALDREVALKTLPALGPAAVRRLRDEARAMAALNHETLATLYGLEMWRHAPVLVVEYFPGGTLAHRLLNGPLWPLEAVALGLRLARALMYMHARGVLHRDLKPSNVAFTATGAAKLLDFGLATLVPPSASVDRTLSGGEEAVSTRWVGTPAYVPPETFRGVSPSPAVDLWALSVVLLEAVCGVNPFSTGSGGTALPDIRLRLDSRPALRAFLERALADSPGRRFQTASEFEIGLAAVAADDH
jgi:hypothetical protein